MTLAERYKSLVLKLFPRGLAFPRASGKTLEKLSHAIGEELARVETRADELLLEFPQTATETLLEWERLVGVPDECASEVLGNIDTRRASVVARLRAVPDNSPAGIVSVLASFGYTATVKEYSPFRVSVNGIGDPVAGPEWQLYYSIHIDTTATETFDFRAGVARANDRLLEFGFPTIECLIEKITPAHTVALFVYEG